MPSNTLNGSFRVSATQPIGSPPLDSRVAGSAFHFQSPAAFRSSPYHHITSLPPSMADAEVSSRPYVATYGRRQQRREETPLSDVEGQSSQPSPRPRDALFLDSSPVHNGGASRRSRNATNDEETGNTDRKSVV